MKSLSISYKALAISVILFTLSFGLLSGTVQSYIHFADPLNEISACICTLTAGTLAAFCIFSTKD